MTQLIRTVSLGSERAAVTAASNKGTLILLVSITLERDLHTDAADRNARDLSSGG